MTKHSNSELLMWLATEFEGRYSEPQVTLNQRVLSAYLPTAGGKARTTIVHHEKKKLSVQMVVSRKPRAPNLEADLRYRDLVDEYRVGLFQRWLGPVGDNLVYGVDITLPDNLDDQKVDVTKQIKALAKELHAVRTKIMDIWPVDFGDGE